MNAKYTKYDLKFFLRNLRYRVRLRPVRARERGVLYFVFEPNMKHAGLADRFKAAIALYNLCKRYGYTFKMYWQTPFALTDYLVPQTNWPMRLKQLEYSLHDTLLINEQNWHPMPQLKPDKQYHCYNYVGNLQPRVFADTGLKWCDLFHELFAPSPKLEQAYRALDIPPRSYISIHIRFVNALEQFEHSFWNNHLDTQEERDKLIARCKRGIHEICNEHAGTQVYVFSDSSVFLRSINDLPIRTLSHDNIGHVSEGVGTAAQLKAFLDLYVISQSKSVYRLIAPELYNWSGYALTAATIGDIPFHDRQV